MEQMIKRANSRPLLLAAIFLLTVAVSLLQAVPAFAADEETVTVSITAGEHGSVNGHTGSFSETLKSGENLTLSMQADDGYVIETVLINETELEAEDLEDVRSKKTGEMTLEEVAEDMSVAVRFLEGETAEENTAETGNPESEDESGNEDTASAGETETGDPAADTGDTDDNSDAVNSEDGDPENEDSTNQGDAGDQEGGTTDTGSADAENSAEETDADTVSKDGSTAAQTDDSGDSQGGDDASASDDVTATEQTDDSSSRTDDASASSDKSSTSEGKAGTGAAAPDKGITYVSDSSPQTGDSFPMRMIGLLIASLGMIGAIIAEYLLKRRHHLQD